MGASGLLMMSVTFCYAMDYIYIIALFYERR
jgi:hypothetical protein